jgi:hypothetical protein
MPAESLLIAADTRSQKGGGSLIIVVETIKKDSGNRVLERVCCLLVLNLVSSTPPCIRQPGPRISAILRPVADR